MQGHSEWTGSHQEEQPAQQVLKKQQEARELRNEDSKGWSRSCVPVSPASEPEGMRSYADLEKTDSASAVEKITTEITNTIARLCW